MPLHYYLVTGTVKDNSFHSTLDNSFPKQLVNKNLNVLKKYLGKIWISSAETKFLRMHL